MYDKERQFKFTPWEFLEKLDLLNWFRYAAIVKELTTRKPQSVLEMGPGEGVVKNVMKPFVENYETLDVNQKLDPTHLGDVRERRENLKEKFDAIVAADILEHIPFSDFEKTLKNFRFYLKSAGYVLITIPHRSHYFFWMTSLKHEPRILRFPTLKRLLTGKASIDPDHQWEIGDGSHRLKDVETIIGKSGFSIEKRKKLLYVDFWVLKKN